ncbi:SITS-binding protein-like [Hyperolius riggenbachi]|uniref:SITS-binding protein-like n=1 Tax=Hyperolius riggenbachi TaxID=752182 RepID=UPI0035A28A51
MPHSRSRNQSPIPEVNWDMGLKEMNETWKGAIACVGVAIFFVMTIGIIYWQVMDQPNKNWILKGRASGLIWERNTHMLVLQTLSEDKTFMEIDVGNFPDMEQNFVKNLCWLNKTEFCYTWDSATDLKISLDRNYSAGTECYNITWTPVHCDVKLKDCFSMTNISWYGGATLSAQHWPWNNVNVALQPFVISNLKSSPGAYGSVSERYFLGSTGVSVVINPHIPISMSVEKNKWFCIETPASTERIPLQYTICAGKNIQSVHQDIGIQLYENQRTLPNINIFRMSMWSYYGVSDSEAKLEREVKSFHNKLKRHGMGECLISLNEHSTTLLSSKDHQPITDQGGEIHRPHRGPYSLKHLNISVTSSPYSKFHSQKLQEYLYEAQENYWLSLLSKLDGSMTPILTRWNGQISVRLNITNKVAESWYSNNVKNLISKLGAEYITIEGVEGNTFLEQSIQPPRGFEGDRYTEALAAMVAKLGNSAIITASTRSSYLPLFVKMAPLQSDWGYGGLKGVIPSLLHYSLLGYNFFIPDAIGGTLGGEFVTEEELFIRWLQIATFLPVMAFHTPPWVCCDRWVLNLTRQYIQKHHDLVAPLLMKYADEWLSTGKPIYRPVWWLSPEDPVAIATDDEFLIGDEMLVAPITRKGHLYRDIYLPGKDYLWMDANTSQVFDGGTILRSYSIGLQDLPMFIKKNL